MKQMMKLAKKAAKLGNLDCYQVFAILEEDNYWELKKGNN